MKGVDEGDANELSGAWPIIDAEDRADDSAGLVGGGEVDAVGALTLTASGGDAMRGGVGCLSAGAGVSTSSIVVDTLSLNPGDFGVPKGAWSVGVDGSR